MAGGLGTRMRSATPKHLHPLLGRRMVDWVVEAARDSGIARVVVVASPDSAASFDGVEVAVQHEALGTGDAVRSARDALAGAGGDVVVLNGDVPAADSGHRARARRDAPVRGRRRDGARVRARRPPLVRPHRARRERPPRADRRGRRRVGRTSSRSARSTPASTSSARRSSGPSSTASSRTTRRASSTSPTRSASSSPTARRRRPHGGDGLGGRGDQHPRRARLRRRQAPRPDQRGAHARRRHDRRSGLDLDRGRRRDRARRDDPPAERHSAAPVRIAASAPRSGRSPTSAPGTALGEGAKIGHVRRGEEVDRRRPDEDPPPLLHRRRRDRRGYEHRAGNITANFPHEPGKPKGRTTIGSNVRTGVDNVFNAPVDVGDDAWIAPGSVITDDVPPGSFAGFAPRQETKEGWVYEKHGKPDRDS